MSLSNRTLRLALQANGIFSMVSGLISVVFADALADFMEIDALVLRFVGVGVLVFGVTVYWFGRHDTVEPGFAIFTTIADILWVIGSLVLVVAYPDLVSSGGNGLIVVVAAVVLALAITQFVGLRRETK